MSLLPTLAYVTTGFARLLDGDCARIVKAETLIQGGVEAQDDSSTARYKTMLLLILMIVLLLALFGSLPTWPHSRNWGYYPSGGISLVVLILLILFLMGRL